jgi:hypothetical protein
MAAGDAFHREPAARKCAVALDRLACIVGAARIEAAVGAEQRANRVLIAAQQRDENAAASAAAPRIASRGTAWRTRTITSKRSTAGRASRSFSRSRRRKRLRSTASAIARRGMMKPTRPGCCPAGAATSCRKRPSMRTPSRKIASNARAPRRR